MLIHVVLKNIYLKFGRWISLENLVKREQKIKKKKSKLWVFGKVHV